jgi:hypothetical protein
MRPLAAASFAASLLAAAIAVAPAARAQAPAPADPTPRTEVGPHGAERRITIAGATLTLRPSADGFVDATLTAPAARVYEVLAAALGDVGLSVKEVDPRIQQVGTGPFRAQFRVGKQRLSTFVDCGTDAQGLRQADSFAFSMRVTTQVVAESAERATVRTLLQATGRPASTSGNDMRCPTTGKLEERIAEAVARRLAPGGG